MQEKKLSPYKVINRLFKQYYTEDVYATLDSHSPEHTINSYQSWMSNIYEKFFPNQLYGITALSRFLFNYWDSDLNLILPHGISKNFTWSKEFIPGYPICTYSSYMESAYLRGAIKKKFESSVCRLTFPPILVTKSNILQVIIRESSTAKRLLIILSKDQAGISYDQTRQILEALKQVNKIQSDFHEINLLLYYKDFLSIKNQARYVELKRSFKHIFCCGHQHDPLFSARLASIISHHKYIYTNQISTHTYLSHSVGASIYFEAPKSKMVKIDSSEYNRTDFKIRKKREIETDNFYMQVFRMGKIDQGNILYSHYNHNFSYETNKDQFIKKAQEGLCSNRILTDIEQTQIDPILD